LEIEICENWLFQLYVSVQKRIKIAEK
jgi:hypothetical protein